MQSQPAADTDAGPPALDPHAAGLIARLEQVPFSLWHVKARVVMGSATFLDALNALSLAFVLPVLTGVWKAGPVEIGLLLTSSYIGQLIGALIFTTLAEKYGRIRSVATATAIMSVMSIVCALCGNFPALFACRLIQGIGVGGEMPVAATYVSELSRARGRGRFFMLYEMIFPIGLMATGQLGAALVPLLGWKIMFVIAGVPGLIITALLLRLPESPRWLIGRGRYDEAETVIAQAEASARRSGATYESATSGRVGAAPVFKAEKSRWSELLSSQLRWRSLVVWVLWACAYFVSNSMNNWMPTLYKSVYHLKLGDSLRAAAMNNVAQVAMLLLCAFCIDRIGRRNWVAAAFVVGGLLLAWLGFGGAHDVTLVIWLVTLSYGVIGSANAVLYLYTPEIYPTRIRAMGTGMATSWLRLASAVGPTLVGVMVTRAGVGSVFLMFAGVSVVGAVAALGMIETQGRRLEDLSR